MDGPGRAVSPLLRLLGHEAQRTASLERNRSELRTLRKLEQTEAGLIGSNPGTCECLVVRLLDGCVRLTTRLGWIYIDPTNKDVFPIF